MGVGLFRFFSGVEEDSSIDVTGSFIVTHLNIFSVINDYTHFKFFNWFWNNIPFTELISRD
jgi:hypothetical protein